MALRPLVEVVRLGRMSFAQALQAQHECMQRHLDSMNIPQGAAPHKLILVEHEPVYTVGHRSQDYTQDTEQKLRGLGADFQVTNRGGLITFHGPGQLVAYPILNLKDLKLGMRQYICCLQKTVIETCQAFGVEAGSTEHTGVWVQDRKICAMGVHGRRFITSHGLALNVDMDLTWFQHITPCGLVDKEVTSLGRELQRNISLVDVIPHFLVAFGKQFNVDLKESDTNFLHRANAG